MIKQTLFNEISVKSENGDWARLLWEDSGRVIIIGDHGHWSYFWGHRGESSVAGFLSELDSGYMGKKMLGGQFRKHSDSATVAAIKAFIRDERKNGGMGKEKAAEEWSVVESYADGDCDYRGWIDQTTICEPWDLGRTEVSSDWTSFWERLWVPLIQPQLRVLCGTIEESK